MNKEQLITANELVEKLKKLERERLEIERCLNSNEIRGIYLNTKNNVYDINLSTLTNNNVQYLVELYLVHLKREIESLKLKFEEI